MDEKNAYLQKLHIKFDELNAKIDKMKVNAGTIRAEKQMEIQKSIKNLQAKRKAIEKMVEDLRAAGEKTWEDLKTDIDSAWDSLQEDLKRAESRCK